MRRLNSHPFHRLALSPLACACLSAMAMTAHANKAQTPPSDAAAVNLPTIGVTATSPRSAKADITGWGDGPAWQQPVQAQTFSEAALKDANAQRLSDLVKLDASVTDGYNTVGYWDYLTVRGFKLDHGYNFRREGLPVSAETRFAFENKDRIEVLKGIAGLQSGVSSPGGMVNMLVKRPQERVRSATFSLDDAGALHSSVDLSDRFGDRQQFGLRANAGVAKLNTHFDGTQGHSRMAALAADWRASSTTLIEIEMEHSERSQPTLAGAALLNTALPSGLHPNTNFNQQAWTLPVEMRDNTSSIRWREQWHPDWHSVVSYGEQHLQANDRMAFPYGCEPSSGDYLYAACEDGSIDLYDFRSENEKRRMRAFKTELHGNVSTGEIRHQLRFEVLRALYATDLKDQAYNWVGTINYSNPNQAFGPAPVMDDGSPNRWERTTEFAIQDTMQLSDEWTAWLGLRHTRLNRRSVETDGKRDKHIEQTLNTPWAAIGWRLAPQTQAYLSWGEGMESETASRAPGDGLLNAGEILPALKSRQTELGIKGQYQHARVNAQWGASLFEIRRPQANTINDVFMMDGDARHRGLEGYWHGRVGAWTLGGSAMLLDAKRRGSAEAGINGKKPVNVPDHTLRLSAAYTLANALPLTLHADVIHEGKRAATTDNATQLKAWTRLDMGARMVQTLTNQQTITWRLGINNVLNNRAWRESPSMFGGHTYLFRMTERTLTASAQIDF